MANRETLLLKEIQVELSRDDSRLWRNNTGEAWAGYAIPAPPGLYKPGAIVIEVPTRVNFGLAVGSGDLIGLRSREITPAMVGQTIAVFASVEIKSYRGNLTPEQQAWISFIKRCGGYAGMARTIDDARHILQLT